jgi:hypothetical protein
VDAGDRNFGLTQVKLVFDFSVFLWDRVQTFHGDVSKCGRRFGIRDVIAEEGVIHGIHDCKKDYEGGEHTSCDVNRSLQGDSGASYLSIYLYWRAILRSPPICRKTCSACNRAGSRFI